MNKNVRHQRNTKNPTCIATQTDTMKCHWNLKMCWVIFNVLLGHLWPDLKAESMIPIYSHCGGHGWEIRKANLFHRGSLDRKSCGVLCVETAKGLLLWHTNQDKPQFSGSTEFLLWDKSPLRTKHWPYLHANNYKMRDFMHKGSP